VIPPAPGTLIGGKYRVVRPIGAGGFGLVLLARHEKLDRDVALKLVHPDAPLGRDATTRLLSEARLAARIRSDHVARVLDVDEDESGAPYIVLEHLHGTDLAMLVKEKGALPWPTAVDYVVQAGDAVFEAHALGIVHRDLKPANLFLERGTPNRIKVLDFGIAIEVGRDRDPTRAGSPRYMAPELLLEKGADERTDVWGLGVTLYELLTGRPPFEGPDLQRVLACILNVTPASPSALQPAIPSELDAVVERCLEKDPDRRFSSVYSLLEALAALREAESARVMQRVRELRELSDLPPASGRGVGTLGGGATTVLSGELASNALGSSTGALGRTLERGSRRTGIVRGAIAIVTLSGIGLVLWQAGKPEPARFVASAPSALAHRALAVAPPSATPTASARGRDTLPMAGDASAPPAELRQATPGGLAAPASASKQAVDPFLLEDRE
jgi:serine/threonine-protein kinase